MTEVWAGLVTKTLLSSSAPADDPVRRGFSGQSQTLVEYWVARSSRAMTADGDCGLM
jgi:hypothetical protein